MKLTMTISFLLSSLLLLFSSVSAQDQTTGSGAGPSTYLCDWQDVEIAPTFNVSHLTGVWYQIANTALARGTTEESCACTAARFTPQNVTSGAGGGQVNDQEEWEKTGNYTVDLLCYNTTNNSISRGTGDGYFPLSPGVGAIAFSFPGEEQQQIREERALLYPGGAEDLVLNVSRDPSTNSDYVVLGSPCFLNAYIYSRSPTMSDEAFDEARNTLRERGYPLTVLGLERTNQNDTSCEAMRQYINNITEETGASGGSGATTSAPPTLRRRSLFSYP